MKKYNIIVILNQEKNRLLMCKRSKNPYIGLLNFVGGKVEENETSLEAAYRELQEETAIKSEDVLLRHLVDFTYYEEDFILEIFFGTLNKDVVLKEEVNKLFWSKIEDDYYNRDKYAGDGNMEHIMSYIKSKI